MRNFELESKIIDLKNENPNIAINAIKDIVGCPYRIVMKTLVTNGLFHDEYVDKIHDLQEDKSLNEIAEILGKSKFFVEIRTPFTDLDKAKEEYDKLKKTSLVYNCRLLECRNIKTDDASYFVVPADIPLICFYYFFYEKKLNDDGSHYFTFSMEDIKKITNNDISEWINLLGYVFYSPASGAEDYDSNYSVSYTGPYVQYNKHYMANTLNIEDVKQRKMNKNHNKKHADKLRIEELPVLFDVYPFQIIEAIEIGKVVDSPFSFGSFNNEEEDKAMSYLQLASNPIQCHCNHQIYEISDCTFRAKLPALLEDVNINDYVRKCQTSYKPVLIE